MSLVARRSRRGRADRCKVTVIVPVFNTGAALDELVASIEAQTMPTSDFEVIFVDDGSTDGTGARLDALAQSHDNFVVRHIPNSGWPGTPRNLGLELARGEFVAFLDHDDYLGARSLELVHEFASQHSSDIVVAREVGVGRNIGRFVFRQTIVDAELDRDPVMQLLTPHKVYRRSLLTEHQIRFPSGKIRLEDHQFNVQAFFAAARVSIYADYAYYFWTKREGVRSASSERFAPHEYFQVAVNAVLDVVDRHTDPGPYRDRIKAYWLGKKLLAHLSGDAMLNYSDSRRHQIVEAVGEVVRQRFTPGTTAFVEFPMRVREHLVQNGRQADLVALAEAERGVTAKITTETVAGENTEVAVRFTMELGYQDGSPVEFRRSGAAVLWTPPIDLGPLPEAVLDVSRDLEAARLHLLLKRRDAAEDHSVCAAGTARLVRHGHQGSHRILFDGEARIAGQDLSTLPGPASPVIVDVSAELDALGRRSVRRLPVPAGQRSLPAVQDSSLYPTRLGNLSIKTINTGADIRVTRCSASAHRPAAKPAAASPGPAATGAPAALERATRPTGSTDCSSATATQRVKVSVIIPVYNPGPYIQACIDGLLAQTLPTDQFEVIFVDDGSTDETPELLDALADRHPHLRVIHQENSGWPGQPRNVGIDAAGGEFVFFCDHDDWLGDEALERMYGYAVEHEADVLIGKMAGLGRAVANNLFSKTQPHATVANSAIMDSLTPHKLFRLSFLDQEGIRFPEGKRRLEDHLFVVTAYLLARTICVYSDYTCYYHIRRSDGANAAFRAVDWDGYFANLREALDIVVEHTEAGPVRDRMFRRWLQTEMVKRATGANLLRLPETERTELIQAAHRTAAQYFGPGVVDQLPLAARAVAQALIAGDLVGLLTLAERETRWTGRSQLSGVTWSADTLVIEGTAALGQLAEHGLETTADVVRALVGAADPETLGRALTQGRLVLYALNRGSAERWDIPATSQLDDLHWTFRAELDPSQLAGGGPLPPGRWDVYVEMSALGLRRRTRLELPATSALDDSPSDRSEPLAGHPVAAYYTKGNRGLTIAVGKKFEPPVRKAAARAKGTTTPPSPESPAVDQSPLAPPAGPGPSRPLGVACTRDRGAQRVVRLLLRGARAVAAIRRNRRR